jgi:hypothetical protein
MRYRKLGLLLGLALIAIAVAGTASAASSKSSVPVIKDSQLHALYTTTAGAKVLSTTRTLQHWHGTALNPDNGLTYGFNMVGANPNCATTCDATIPIDVIPINVVVDGVSFRATDILQGTLSSPVFALNAYGSTPAATGPDVLAPGDTVATCSTANGDVCLPKGPGGILSQGDNGVPLQLEDATMRAQFNKTGASPYHLRLSAPTVRSTLTIVVPPGDGTLLLSSRGVLFASVSYNWWGTRIGQLNNTLGYMNPTRLPIYLTNNVLLHIGPDPTNCCVIGFHGASEVVGHGTGSTHGSGNQPVQTYAWASWVRPGIYARPNGGTDWALQDIHALSHEIAEWGDDPFVNNRVEPWLTPTAPQYGCTAVLETGDPVVSIGFSMGANSTDQTPNPWTSPANHTPSVSYDGTYHPEDEVFLPWFMRTSPNTISEPTQSPSGNIGRYTLMGDLNPFPGFRAPATGC